MLQIRDQTAVIYQQPDPGGDSTKRRENMLSVRKGRYGGEMSGGAKKRLTRAITLMAMGTKPTWRENPVTKILQYHHLSFITLTVSDSENITAREAYDNLLDPMLQWMRRTVKDCTCYIWKAEVQKRGQIHYHIICPAMIHYKVLRDKWNRLQWEAGYLDKYAKKHGHFKPNSTDIHAVSKKGNTTNYLVKAIAKEMTKSIDAVEVEIRAEVMEELRTGKLDHGTVDPEYLTELEIKHRVQQETTLNGKCWDTSDNLAGAKYFTIPFEKHHLDMFDVLDSRNAVKLKEPEGETKYWHLLIFTSSSPPDLLTPSEKREMNDYFKTLLN